MEVEVQGDSVGVGVGGVDEMMMTTTSGGLGVEIEPAATMVKQREAEVRQAAAVKEKQVEEVVKEWVEVGTKIAKEEEGGFGKKETEKGESLRDVVCIEETGDDWIRTPDRQTPGRKSVRIDETVNVITEDSPSVLEEITTTNSTTTDTGSDDTTTTTTTSSTTISGVATASSSTTTTTTTTTTTINDDDDDASKATTTESTSATITTTTIANGNVSVSSSGSGQEKSKTSSSNISNISNMLNSSGGGQGRSGSPLRKDRR
ncbi:Hypothetical predicted protein [Octopus vulgaris]|uniref:Uncharacterized protein n=1 Tax=Octopus vulgaris TaxID=6645 RepID=A0AA36BZU7_OCTVU|nr:Hypothetical predicted protein [Octopus vulgaris]